MSFRLLLLTLFAIGAAYLTLVGQIELDPWSAQDTINSRTLPQIYGALLCLAVLGLALGQRDRTGDMSHPSLRKLKPLFWLSALICVFILSLVWLNLWVALGGLLFGTLWTMGEKRLPVIVALCLAIPLIGFVLVEQVLQMTVPLS